MLNGSCPVIVFQKTDFNKVSVAGSVYLDEDLTGLALMSQNGRVELASDSIITAGKGKGLVSKDNTLKIKQRGIANGVDIVLKASRDSIGLNALLPLIDTAFQKAATGEYFVSYFNRNIALFKSKLASFSTNESPYDTSVTINISLIKEDMPQESKEKKKYNIALPEIGDKTKPNLINKVPKQVNELINKGSEALNKADGIIGNIVSSLNEFCDQAKEFIKKGSNYLGDANMVIASTAAALETIKNDLVGRASGIIKEAVDKLEQIEISDSITISPQPQAQTQPQPQPQAQSQPRPQAQAQVSVKVPIETLIKNLEKAKKQMIDALGATNTFITSINANLESAKKQVEENAKNFINKGSKVLNKADGVIDKAKEVIDKVSNVENKTKDFINKGKEVLNEAGGVIDKVKGLF